MSNSEIIEGTLYLIRIKERVPRHILDWFDNTIAITTDQGETLMACSIVDQSALHGVLSKIRDFNLTLISIAKVESPEILVNSNK